MGTKELLYICACVCSVRGYEIFGSPPIRAACINIYINYSLDWVIIYDNFREIN